MKLIYSSNSEMIFKDDNGKKYSLKFPATNSCPICARPVEKKGSCTHHSDLLEQENLKLICGGYYQVDANGEPYDWWTRELKKVTEFPYRFSSELIEYVMKIKLDFLKNFKENILVTMVPTSYLQAFDIFHSISKSLNFAFISPKYFFVKNTPNYISDRCEYIKQKYELAKINHEITNLLKKITTIILFDDVMHTGTTLGYCASLFRKIFSGTIILCPLGRTIGRKRTLEKYFPQP